MLPLLGRLGINPQNGGCLDGILQEVEYYLVVHRHTAEKGGLHLLVEVFIEILAQSRMILGRIAGRSHEITRLGVAAEEVLIEKGGLLQDGIDIGKKLFVAGVEIAFPQVLAEPGITGGPHTARGIVNSPGAPPKVCIVVQRPSTATIHL